MDPATMLGLAAEAFSIVSKCWSAAVKIKQAFDAARENASTVVLLISLYAKFKELVDCLDSYKEQATPVWLQTYERVNSHCRDAKEKLIFIETQVSQPRWKQLPRATPIAVELEKILQDARSTQAAIFSLDGFGSLRVGQTRLHSAVSQLDVSLRDLVCNNHRLEAPLSRVDASVHELGRGQARLENSLSGVESSMREVSLDQSGSRPVMANIHDMLFVQMSRSNHLLDKIIGVEVAITNLSDLLHLSNQMSPTRAGPATSTPSLGTTLTDSHIEHREEVDPLESEIAQVDDKVNLARCKIMSSQLGSEDMQKATRMVEELVMPVSIPWESIEVCGRSEGGFVVPDDIGSGATSIVYKGKLNKMLSEGTVKSFVDVALKSLKGDLPKLRSSLLTEANILLEVRHPCIIQYYGSYWPTGIDKSWPRPMIITELMTGNLVDHRDRIDPKENIKVLRDVAEALEYLHHRGILHLDLKPENILVRLDGDNKLSGRVKVSDFGLSRKKAEKTMQGVSLSVTVVGGTLKYMAPELLTEGARARTSGDVWSFGAVICWLLGNARGQGRSKVQEAAFDALVLDAARGGTMRETWLNSLRNSDVHEDLLELASQCLAVRPEERPRMADVYLAL